MIFKKYKEYENFVTFIFSSQELFFVYKPADDVEEAYIRCEIDSIDKSEIGYSDSLLRCKISIKPLTMWTRKRVYPFSNTIGNVFTDVYQYTYAHTYASSTTVGAVVRNEIEVAGHAPADLVLELTGASQNPEWWINEKTPATSGGLNFVADSASQIVVTNIGEYMHTYSGDRMIDDFLMHDRRNYLTLPIGKNELNIQNVEQGQVTVFEYFYTI